MRPRAIRRVSGQAIVAEFSSVQFLQPFQPSSPVQSRTQKKSTSVLPKSVLSSLRPASTRGAFRDRHERGRWDAVAATGRETSASVADGEAGWFWRPFAGVKSATTPTRRADDGVNKASGPRGERGVSVCRGKAWFLRGCKSLPARVAPAGSNRSRREGNDPSEAFDIKGHSVIPRVCGL